MSGHSELLMSVGFVTIGRNEGERLQATLKAIKQQCPSSPIVYVDSGSTDNSVAFAESIGVDVVELDLSVPFTAARARNAGYARLKETHANLVYVQFFDGDCEMIEGWINHALDALNQSDDTAVVSGRRCEKFPSASIYNTLMDIEWNTPIGETKAVPGDMCVKTAAFEKIDGFTETIIAAEDDDFCLRIRKAGFRVFRIDANMSLHDANIMKLSQWYRRSKRGGHGYANINNIHGGEPDHYFRKELRSVTLWGAIIPTVFLISVFAKPIVALIIAIGFLMFVAKTALRRKMQGHTARTSIAYALLIYTGKVPEFLGIIEYWKNHLLSRKHQLIEYK